MAVVSTIFYVINVIIILIICPIILYMIVPDSQFDIIYSFSAIMTTAVMSLVIIDGSYKVIKSIWGYKSSKKHEAWNVVLGRYQVAPTNQLDLINRTGGPTIIKDVPVSEFKDFTVVLEKKVANVAVIVRAGTNLQILMKCIESLRLLHYGKFQIFVVAENLESLWLNTSQSHSQNTSNAPNIPNTSQSHNSNTLPQHIPKFTQSIHAALNELTDDTIVGLIDYNCCLEKYSLLMAVDNLLHGDVDILQGRCTTLSQQAYQPAFIPYLLHAVENELMYAMDCDIDEPIRGSCMFGGNNMWCWAKHLRSLSDKFMCPDIELCSRLYLEGRNIEYNPNVLCYQLFAPAFVTQRIFWTMAWFQVMINAFRLLFKEGSFPRKLYIVRVVILREILYYVSAQSLLVLLSGLIVNPNSYTTYLKIGPLLNLSILPIQLFVAYVTGKFEYTKNHPEGYVKLSFCKYLMFWLISPIYIYFKFVLAILGRILYLLSYKIRNFNNC